jgi:hypothetical protein
MAAESGVIALPPIIVGVPSVSHPASAIAAAAAPAATSARIENGRRVKPNSPGRWPPRLRERWLSLRTRFRNRFGRDLRHFNGTKMAVVNGRLTRAMVNGTLRHTSPGERISRDAGRSPTGRKTAAVHRHPRGGMPQVLT